MFPACSNKEPQIDRARACQEATVGKLQRREYARTTIRLGPNVNQFKWQTSSFERHLIDDEFKANLRARIIINVMHSSWPEASTWR